LRGEENYLGKTYGNLTVVKYIPGTATVRTKLLCRCSCGKEKIFWACNVSSSKSLSCGKCGTTRYSGYSYEDGTKNSWRGMLERVRLQKGPYEGIDVDPRWKKLENFIQDMGNRPGGYSIDRIDNSKGYWKNNCRWADRKEQSSNRDYCKMISAFGREETITEWARLTGLSRIAIEMRILDEGLDPEKAMLIPGTVGISQYLYQLLHQISLRHLAKFLQESPRNMTRKYMLERLPIWLLQELNSLSTERPLHISFHELLNILKR